MTEHEQRIAIAKWCGWKYTRIEADGGCYGWEAPGGSCQLEVDQLPDYLRDPNAMHEAEERLDMFSIRKYNEILCGLCLLKPLTKHNTFVWHATVTQRAEALLRTVGLWKDNP